MPPCSVTQATRRTSNAGTMLAVKQARQSLVHAARIVDGRKVRTPESRVTVNGRPLKAFWRKPGV